MVKDRDYKEVTKECRKVEKSFGKVGKNNEFWVIVLYDWVYERFEKIFNMMIKYDFDEKGIVTKDNFSDSLTGMGVLVEEEEMKKVVAVYDKNKDGNVDFNDFLIGKKYVNKNYLMSVFEGKKKKKGKKGKGGKKKGKFKFVMLICIKDEGLRIYGGVLLEMFIERYIYFTDINRFDRDKFLVYFL